MFASHPIRIVSGIFDWQVLQRDGAAAQVCVCGDHRKDDAPGAVYVRVTEEATGKDVIPWQPAAENGAAWTADLLLPTGGPYRLETCAKQDDQSFADAFAGDFRFHFFVGDVFLIAGQSNAVGYARDVCLDPSSAGVSVFRLCGRWELAAHPLNDGTDCKYKNLDVPAPAHSPWLSFAKMVYHTTGLPIGLIPAALGGSPLSAWEPGALLYENALQMIRDSGGRIRGVLWYQGCTDALACETRGYAERFYKMAEGFRAALAAPDLPFFTCQLNGFAEPGSPKDDEAWAEIRNAQAEAAERAGIYLLPTAGMRLYDAIHNCAASNIVIGRLTAHRVMRELYGIETPFADLLQAVAAERLEDEIVLTFQPETAKLSAGPGIKTAITVLAGTKQLPVTRVTARGNTLTIRGHGLQEADQLCFGQRRNMARAGITDRTCGRVAAPFQIKLLP